MFCVCECSQVASELTMYVCMINKTHLAKKFCAPSKGIIPIAQPRGISSCEKSQHEIFMD